MNLSNITINFKEKATNKSKALADFIKYIIYRVKGDSLLRVASALSYTSLLALVPLFAIGFAIFGAFPMFAEYREQLQNLIIENFLPGMGSEINNYFNDFISASAKLTTIGVVGIAVTAIMLLSTIENTFNFIFKVRQPRRFTTKITLYWTIITLGPLLLGTAFSLRGYLFAIKNMMGDQVSSIGFAISSMTPTFITIVLLISVYMLVPNKKVSFKGALFGSVITAFLFFVLRIVFSMMFLNSATYKTLYGAMAAVPILLVWMYMSWAVVIFGAVLTASFDEYKDVDGNEEKKEFKNRNNKNRPQNNRRRYEVRDYSKNKNVAQQK